MLRIISGKHRGRRLETPEGNDVRPTSDRSRESIFNILAHANFAGLEETLLGQPVLDVFCGTGAMGLEAISRGASRATFIDSAQAALDIVRRNATTLGESENIQMVRSDAARLPSARTAFGLVFIDPPYRKDLATPALKSLAEQGWLAPGAILCLEHAKQDEVALPAGFTLEDQRVYGNSRVSFLRFG